jgi:hypothetical protein
MTSETRTMVELKDVLGVEFECPKCHFKVLYPAASSFERLATKCPHCYEPWFLIPEGPQGEETLDDVVKQWLTVMRNLPTRKDMFATMRLHVSNIE